MHRKAGGFLEVFKLVLPGHCNANVLLYFADERVGEQCSAAKYMLVQKNGNCWLSFVDRIQEGIHVLEMGS